jgi:undecaprenyl-diphosphatase
MPPGPAWHHNFQVEVSVHSWMVVSAKLHSQFGRQWSPRIQAAELIIVRRCVSPIGAGRFLAVLGSRLGNGWVYPVLVSALVWSGGQQAWTAMYAAAVSVAALHCIYPFIKAWTARRRPFDADPNLRSLLQPLDMHSFPSGHVMTLTAVAVPIVVAFPATVVPLTALWLLVAWSRVACAHHYPTDVLAGTLLGFSVAAPLAFFWLN